MGDRRELEKLLSLYTTRMGKLSKDLRPGWKTIVEKNDGVVEELTDIARISIINPDYGRVTYGEHPNGGYDAWAIHEPGGGGSVVLPFARIDNELYVGLLEEKRMLQAEDGFARNAVMGFLPLGTSHFETAAEELAEETGMKPLAERMRLLPGEPGNHNSSNFETWGKNRDNEPEGLRFYSYEFLPQELESTGTGCWRPKRELKPRIGAGEKILRCEFMPWHEAALVGDLQTMSAIVRLLAAERKR